MEEKQEKTIVEINGIKLEVDMRYAKRIDTFRIGDPVKVLMKKYSDSYEIKPGVIIDFAAFSARPTIVVAVADIDYSKAELKILHINEDSKDVEIASAVVEELALDKETVIGKMDREIERCALALEDAKIHKDVFQQRFQAYFDAFETGEARA